MIVYYLTRTGFTRRGKITARVFNGTVEFTDGKSRAIRLRDAHVRVIFKATVFDDSIQPPALVRCDYGFHDLRQYGCELPEFYTDHHGSIVRTCDDRIVMEGPNTPQTRWLDKENNPIASPVHPDLTPTMIGTRP